MATRYTVLFDRDAAADLASIRDYIAVERGREFAEEFSLRVVTFCEKFGRFPHRGTRHDGIRPDLRTVTWRKTVAVAFEVAEDARRVLVLAVLYRGRDVLAELRKRQGE